MKFPALALIAATALAGCVAPVGPVEVTRFHDPARAAMLGQGTISVVAAPGEDTDSLELRAYRLAVRQQLQALGYGTGTDAGSAQIAEVRVTRNVYRPERGSPVSVGGGASTGSYGTGVGLGVAIDLSGQPKEQVTTRLAVTIRERGTGEALWEGRADFTVAVDSPMADTQLGAARLAEALFSGFPGNNGETIEIQ